VLANPRATVQVVDPDSAAQYRLALQYLRERKPKARYSRT